MFERIILSLFWIPIFCGAFLLGTHIHVFVILVAVAGLGLSEFLTMCRYRGINPPGLLLMIGGLAVLSVACWLGAAVGLAVAMLVTLSAFAAYPMSGRAEGTVHGASAVALAMIWIPLPLAHIMYVRDLPNGGWMLFMIFGIIWAADSGAYFTGKLVGKIKLSPLISPSKTVEGTIGGFIAGIICTFALGLAIRDFVALSWEALTVLGVGLPVVSLLGDLAESAFKRDIGLKDSGSIMGSHGGILDRVDSLLFAAPTAWYLLALMQALNIPVWN